MLWKEEVQAQVAAITALLYEERTRKPSAPESPEELVWQLHEEIGAWFESEWHGDLYDYWPRPYPFGPRKPVGARAKLQKHGRKAVPALLAELQRKARPSRSAYRSVQFSPGFTEENTQDLALAVLRAIAGIDFHSTAEADGWWQAVEENREPAWRKQFERKNKAPQQ